MEMARAPTAGLRTAQGSQGDIATGTLAGLAADDYGHADDRAPLVLLHGLTFDRCMWRPALASCPASTRAGGSSRWIFPVTARPQGGRPTTSKASPTVSIALPKRRGCNHRSSSGTPSPRLSPQ